MFRLRPPRRQRLRQIRKWADRGGGSTGEHFDLWIHFTTILDDLEGRFGLGHGDGDAQDKSGAPIPAQTHGDGGAREGGREALAQGTGDGDGAEGEQITEVKVKPHSKQEQNHTDL